MDARLNANGQKVAGKPADGKRQDAGNVTDTPRQKTGGNVGAGSDGSLTGGERGDNGQAKSELSGVGDKTPKDKEIPGRN